jgi:hypothetical protein
MSAFVFVNDASEWKELSAAIDANRQEYQEDEKEWNDICAEIQSFGEEYQTSVDIHDYEEEKDYLSEEEQERRNFREMHIYLLQMQGYTYTESEIIVDYYESN